tara:strand:- start:18 stop:1082 length:1065 start_codon:yes stop_codon:yes gene_type:complete
MAYKSKVKTFTILTPTLKYVPLNRIKEPVGLNGGDTDATRWDLDVPAVRKAYDTLIDSIRKNGFLVGVIGIQLPNDVMLFGKPYKKDYWLALDVNGRIRVLRDLEEEGAIFNKGTDIEGMVPVLDVTHIVLKDSTDVDEDIIERLWTTLVTLNTGQMKWTDYDFISTGSRAITDKIQKEVWEYLTLQMKKYHPKLSNKVVLGGTINTLTEEMRTEADIPFDMRFKRYSDEILKVLADVRDEHGSKDAKAPFLTLLAKYLRRSTINSRFKGQEYNTSGDVIASTKKNCFPISGELYTDSHFFEFKQYITYIGDRIVNMIPDKGGFPGGSILFSHFIHEKMLSLEEKYFRKIKKSA